MRTALLILILYLAMWGSESQTCANLLRSDAQNEISNLETGSFILIRDEESRSHTYSIQLQSDPPENFQVVVSIGYIDGYKDDDGLDFNLRAFNKNGTVEVVFFISEMASWQIVHAYFITSWNNYIKTGFFASTANQLLSVQEGQRKIKVQTYIQWDDYGSENSVIAFPFLSGVKTKDRTINLSFDRDSNTFLNNVLSIEFTISDQNEPIETVYISFVLYTKDSTIVIQQQSFQTAEDLIREINGEVDESIHSFGGMRNIDAAGLEQYRKLLEDQQSDQSGLLRQVHALDPTEVNVFIKTFEISSIVLRDQSSIELLRLNVEEAVEENICLSPEKCVGQNGKIVEKDGVKRCAICASGQTYDLISEECACEEDHSRIDGICIKKDEICGENEIFFQEKCLLIVINFRDCVSFERYDEESKTCECVSFAERNQAGECQCSEDTYPTKEGSCQYCPSNASFNEDTQKCECNEGFQGTGLICRKVRDQGLLNLGDQLFIIDFPPTRL